MWREFDSLLPDKFNKNTMQLKLLSIHNPDNLNFILGQSHFIKTVEDLHETLVAAVPNIKFGLAFCEASGPRLIRFTSTDKDLEKLAIKNAKLIEVGHSFIIFLKDTFPINVLNQIKNIAEVCHIFCATANPTQIVVAQSKQGRGILGIIDGSSPLGIESKKDKKARKDFLRTIGYKL